MNIKGDDGVKIFSQQHQNHYISAYKMFRDNMVLGVGVKNFRNYCNVEKYKIDEASCTTHPHNTYIQILSETGIIGFLFIMIALIMFIYNISRHFLLSLNNKNYFTGFEICILSTISITLWPFIPTGNFFNNWLSIIFYFPIGLLLFSLNKKNKTI
jgi:O-antigen ligase